MYINHQKSGKIIHAFEIRELGLRSRNMLKITLLIDVTKEELESKFSAVFTSSLGHLAKEG